MVARTDMTQRLTTPLNNWIQGLKAATPAACFGAVLALGGCSAPDASDAPAAHDPAATAPASEAASESTAPTLSRSGTINADAATVWALISPFCSMDQWHPVVGSCTLGDETPPLRTLITADGSATFIEREVQRDDTARTYSYAILSGPLPVIDYVGTIRVEDTAPGVSTVTWSSQYTTPDGMEETAATTLSGLYDAGFAGISAALAE